MGMGMGSGIACPFLSFSIFDFRFSFFFYSDTDGLAARPVRICVYLWCALCVLWERGGD